MNEGVGESGWIVEKDKPEYDEIFNRLEISGGKVTGECRQGKATRILMFSFSGRSAKEEMMKSQLPNKVLGKVWRLADTDNDGMLDHEEFALAMHLIKVSITDTITIIT